MLQLVKMLFFSEDFRFRPRARRRPRPRMAQLGLMRFRAPGIAQDRSAPTSLLSIATIQTNISLPD